MILNVHCKILLFNFLSVHIECQCNGHGLSCMYNKTLDVGICTSCQHNSTGHHCERCQPKFYRNSMVPINHPSTCLGKRIEYHRLQPLNHKRRCFFYSNLRRRVIEFRNSSNDIRIYEWLLYLLTHQITHKGL